MIRTSEAVEIPGIRAFKKIIPDTNFTTEIPGYPGKSGPMATLY